MGDRPLLRVRGLAKHLRRHVVLDGIDLTVAAGELVALVGENGAGKSTLVRCVSGDLTPDAGEVMLGDDRLPAVVWQDLALCENLDAAANLFLGRELGWPWLSHGQMELRAKALLDELGIDLPDLRRPVRRPSPVAGDRPRPRRTSPPADPRRADGVARDPRDAGGGTGDARPARRRMRVAADLTPHRAGGRHADRVIVLRHGRVVADRPTTELHPDDVVALMAGIDADTTARKQMERLRSLVDQHAEVEPSASIPLIVSALSSAVGADQVCVHLRLDDALRRRAAVGVRAPLLDVNTELPLGERGHRRCRRRTPHVVVTDDIRRDRLWERHRAAATASGVK